MDFKKIQLRKKSDLEKIPTSNLEKMCTYADLEKIRT